MNTLFKNVLIYGLGLMGGSLSLALKKKKIVNNITGLVRNKRSLEEAKSLQIADEIYLEEQFLKENLWNNFDLIVFSLPVDLTCLKIRMIPNDYKGFITDLGSTKKEIIQTVESKFPNTHNYISSHPMTGSEHSGARYAKEELYEGKLCILTKPNNSSEPAYEIIKAFWHYLGSKTVDIPPNDHDDILAYLSHSPHIISTLMVTWAGMNKKVEEYTNASPFPISGGGFRDMTRIAGSNPEMWQAIISTNKNSIYHSLIEFKNRLEELIEEFHNINPENNKFWKDYFEKSVKYKNNILKN
ncbi:MAG: prephenate dehydrogenase [Leptospiraceae bacterium]|nr:prephenate dehydrogenase [Leptospiraceae bacterium]